MEFENIKICVAQNGSYLGAHIGALPENTYQFVPVRPNDPRDIWDFENLIWTPYIAPSQPYPQDVIISSANGVLVRVTADDNGEVYGEKIE